SSFVHFAIGCRFVGHTHIHLPFCSNRPSGKSNYKSCQTSFREKMKRTQRKRLHRMHRETKSQPNRYRSSSSLSHRYEMNKVIYDSLCSSPTAATWPLSQSFI